jgi:hypothetical protein
MMRRLFFVLPVSFLLAPSLGCSGRDEPAVVDIYRLNGKYLDELQMAEESGETLAPPAEMFHDWPVLERRRVTEAALAKELAAAVTSRSNFGGSPAACFWPGLGVAVGEGEERLDAVICLQCNQLYRYAPGESEERLVLSDQGAKKLTSLYQRAFPQPAGSSQGK